MITDTLCSKYNLPKIKVEVKHTRQGRARKKTNKITIPKFAIGYGYSFSLYYIIHEVCHFIIGYGHRQDFKNKEIEILKDYNLLPIYSRAYAKQLYDLSGNLLWDKKRR